MYKKWTELDFQYLIEHYPYDSYESLTSYLKCTKRALIHVSNKLKLKRSKSYTINQTFFDTWSSDMAYILGIIITDGCIGDDNRLSFGVGIKDRCILDYIASQLVPGKPVKIATEIRNGIGHLTARLKFTSKYIANKLKDYNIIPRKTGKEILPECPDEFKGDLLRGIFDGDGWISIRDTGQKVCGIVSASKQFLEEIKNILDCGYIYNKHYNCYVWQVYKKEHIQLVAKKLYYNSNIFCLNRKRDKFYE